MGYTNFKPTIWSKQIQLDLMGAMKAKQFANTNFDGEVGRGKTVKIIGLANPTVKTYVSGTTIATAETPTDTSILLAVDQYKYQNFQVDDIDKAQSHVEIMNSLTKGCANAFAADLDKYVMTKFADATNVSTETTAITTSALAKTAVDAMFKAMWKNKVDINENTYLVVSPDFYALLLDAIIPLSTSNVDMLKSGIVGSYRGAQVLMSNYIYNDATYDYIGLVTKDAIALATGIEELEPYRPEGLFSDAIKALHTYGAKVVRQEQLIVKKVKYA